MSKPQPAKARRQSRTPAPPPQVVKPKKQAAAARSIATYEDALTYLNDRVHVERMRPKRLDPDIFKLDRMHALMEALGNPHRDFKSVHVAGSKGKGSTCEMLAASLAGCGYTTGLYTSPHVLDLRERIRINNQMIGPQELAQLVADIAEAVPAVQRKFGAPTFFELLTACGFLHFARQAVDIAVVEVGLGGRLDSTNVINPEVCGLTSIQLEHTQILGDTLELIAREKAGIMKPGVTAITVPQTPGVLGVFKEVADAVGANLQVLGKDLEYSYRFEATPELGPHVRVCLSTPRSNYEHLPVPLKGEHQAPNAGLVLAILDKLKDRGFETPERLVALGLAKTKAPGRLEQVWDRPRILVDGAHNPESIQALMKAIGAHMKLDSMVVVFGCAADKNVEGMLAKLATGADKIIFTKAQDSARAIDPRELQRTYAELTGKVMQAAPTVKDALNLAAQAVGREDLICVTGSFYVAGEAKRLLMEKKQSIPGKPA